MRMDVSAGALQRLRSARARRPALAAFIGVFAATFLAFLAVGGVLPVLPRYVRGPIGAGDLAVGIVVGAFAFTAVIGRPIGGRLSDTRGRRAIVIAGLLICAAAGALYLVPAGVAGLVFARLVLGVGDGWVFTAGATWIVDLAPPARRGQAIGLFGLAIWGGLSIGPILGQAILDAASYDWVFAFAAITPLLGAAVALRVPDSPVAPVPRERGESLIPRAVVAPGAALALANIGYGTVAGFVVLHLSHRGVGHGATVFTAFAASVVLARLVAGRIPDTLGPVRAAAGAGCAEALGLALLLGASPARAQQVRGARRRRRDGLGLLAAVPVAGTRRGAVDPRAAAWCGAGRLHRVLRRRLRARRADGRRRRLAGRLFRRVLGRVRRRGGGGGHRRACRERRFAWPRAR